MSVFSIRGIVITGRRIFLPGMAMLLFIMLSF